jgi:hypothetical protein
VMTLEKGIYDATAPIAEYTPDVQVNLTGSLRRDSSSSVASGRRILVSGTP